jgi:hypothetical protein
MLVALKCQEDSGKAIGSGKVGNESDLRHSALDPELLELARSSHARWWINFVA